jgi:hypothetical protein
LNLLKITLVVGLLLASGCTAKTASPAPPICDYRGNSAADKYCATTYIQLLASPETYDGLRVSFNAWGTQYNNKIYLFPTRDELDSANSSASIMVEGVSNSAAQMSLFQSRNGVEMPRRVTVVGEFRFNHSMRGATSNQKVALRRFGRLIGVTEISGY